jgi:photosystem II stability/assembly factor-like uncharacterized protein
MHLYLIKKNSQDSFFIFGILLCLIFSHDAYSQLTTDNKLAFPDSSVFTGKANVLDAEEAMFEFKKKNQLHQYGGWKWYGRFLSEYGQRAGSNGELPSSQDYLQILETSRKPNVDIRSSNGWYPIGPFQKPSTLGNLRSYGMGRANCISFHPTNAGIWYVGFGQAGIWKTTDSGKTWTETNNGLPILRISDIAIDPNNTNVLYCCVGDFAYCEISLLSVDRKRNTHYGMGVYKSTDGGNSWNPTGLSAKQTDFDGSLFRRVFVNPKNSNELVAAGVSGIYKSQDAGASWTKVYNEVIGDLELNESNSNILYAAGRWMEFTNTGAADILKSYDFGNTWQKLTVPWNASGVVTRIEIALAPSDTNYIYANCVGGNGGELKGFYLSKNAGKDWKKVYNWGYNLMSGDPEDSTTQGYSQGKYDLALCVHPTDKNRVYLGGIQVLYSSNGGADFAYAYSPDNHVDEHQFKIHPKLNKWILCNDGGVYAMPINPVITTFKEVMLGTVNKGTAELLCKNMNVGSFYRVGISRFDTTAFVSGAQDNGSILGKNWSFLSGGMEWIVRCYLMKLLPLINMVVLIILQMDFMINRCLQGTVILALVNGLHHCMWLKT